MRWKFQRILEAQSLHITGAKMSNLNTRVNRGEKYFLPEMQGNAKVSEFCDTCINSFDKSDAKTSLQSWEDANTVRKLWGNISRANREVEEKMNDNFCRG